jgi:hypothetical protein
MLPHDANELDLLLDGRADDCYMHAICLYQNGDHAELQRLIQYPRFRKAVRAIAGTGFSHESLCHDMVKSLGWETKTRPHAYYALTLKEEE